MPPLFIKEKNINININTLGNGIVFIQVQNGNIFILNLKTITIFVLVVAFRAFKLSTFLHPYVSKASKDAVNLIERKTPKTQSKFINLH